MPVVRYGVTGNVDRNFAQVKNEFQAQPQQVLKNLFERREDSSLSLKIYRLRLVARTDLPCRSDL